MQADNNSQIRAKKLSKKANRQKGEPILKTERRQAKTEKNKRDQLSFTPPLVVRVLIIIYHIFI
jgi:hypothetical protein